MLILTAVLVSNALSAQTVDNAELSEVLRVKDSLLFAAGFNECNLQYLEELTHKDFEFYHDKGGITESKAAFVATIKNNLCSSGQNVVRRQLDARSLTVYPLYKEGVLYGAVQTGIHSFDNTTAKFTHLWLLENSKWKLSRVLSYDHQIL